ncbi:MAG: SRPBCC domain-containing protein [Bacteroidetes bacterium]|nr:SRPBCC domain-containing protein [Bacteroidota bacterium]
MKNDITGKVSIHINATTDKVWEALTTPETIKKYFFDTDAVSDWKVGSSLIFKGEWEGKKYEDKGTILENIPGKTFQYDYWSSMSGIEDKQENYLIITYSLEKKDDGTDLTITQENIQDEKTKVHSEQNWTKVITDLKNLLEE